MGYPLPEAYSDDELMRLAYNHLGWLEARRVEGWTSPIDVYYECGACVHCAHSESDLIRHIVIDHLKPMYAKEKQTEMEAFDRWLEVLG